MAGITLGEGSGKSNKDRNEFPLGPYHIDVDREVPQVRQKAEAPKAAAAVTSTVGSGDFKIEAVDAGASQGGLGALSDGTSFINGTGFTVNVGDVVTYTEIEGTKVAISIYTHAIQYQPITFTSPQFNNNFPYTGTSLSPQHNYDFAINPGTSAYTASIAVAIPVSFYDSGPTPAAPADPGILGYSGRVVVMLGGNQRVAQPPIVIYNVETGAVTSLTRTAAVGATNRTRGLGAVGTRLFVTYDGTSGNCVESWDSTTGTWSTHAISHAVFAGVSEGRAWWVGYSTGGTRYRIHSIDESGTLSSIDYPVNIAFSTTITTVNTSYVFAKAQNGSIWVSLHTTTPGNNKIVHAYTTSNAAGLSLVVNTSPHASTTTLSTNANYQLDQFPWSRVNSAGAVDYRELNRAEAGSDIHTDGSLYYALRSGTPAAWGYGVINTTTYVPTYYNYISSGTGLVADGELTLFGGLSAVDHGSDSFGNPLIEVVMYGSVKETAYDPTVTRTLSWLPAFWRTDGTTVSLNANEAFMGVAATGSSTNGTDITGRSAKINRYDITLSLDETIVLLDNTLQGVETVGGSIANINGPAYVQSLLLDL